MGTRSITNIFDKDWDSETKRGKLLCTLYRQYDGNPCGHGQNLFDIINPLKMVNGFTFDGAPQANGMGCLAAQIIAGLKDGVGNVYVYPSGSNDCGEEYIYNLWLFKGGVRMSIIQVGWGDTPNRTIFRGMVSNFNAKQTEEKEDTSC